MLPSTRLIARGTTVYFSTTFYDVNSVVVQPEGATLNIVYIDANSAQQSVQIEMDAPTGPAVEWTAEWDTRDVWPSTVSWSIHTTASGPPFAVEDGSFVLTANPANLVTFS